MSILDRFKFAYHAVVDKKRRTAPSVTTQSEEKSLDTTDRKKLVATARDNRRNQALLAWMIRQHCDFVSRFTFQPQNDNEELNARLRELVDWRSQAKQWDVAGRHSRSRWLRILEACRTVDGDVGVIKTTGGRMQAIEGDRIAAPTRSVLPAPWDQVELTHGIQLDSAGKALNYCVCKRDKTGSTSKVGGQVLLFDQMVPADDFALIGYFDRFDSVRGVSPLCASLNHLTDVYESIEYINAKIKHHAMFGTFLKRAALTGSDGFSYVDAATAAAPTASTTRYQFELKPGLKIEGEPGDELQLIESKTPPLEFLEYTNLQVRIALLSLDIPYTFWDVLQASYSGQRMDMIRYMKSVEAKRDDLREFLDDITRWDIARWVLPWGDANEPALKLPKGMLPRDVKFRWVAEGVPWIDKAREVTADMLAVSAGFETRDDVVQRTSGQRFVDVVAQLGREEEAAVEASATIAIGQPGQASTRDEEAGNEANQGAEPVAGAAQKGGADNAR